MKKRNLLHKQGLVLYLDSNIHLFEERIIKNIEHERFDNGDEDKMVSSGENEENQENENIKESIEGNKISIGLSKEPIELDYYNITKEELNVYVKSAEISGLTKNKDLKDRMNRQRNRISNSIIKRMIKAEAFSDKVDVGYAVADTKNVSYIAFRILNNPDIDNRVKILMIDRMVDNNNYDAQHLRLSIEKMFEEDMLSSDDEFEMLSELFIKMRKNEIDKYSYKVEKLMFERVKFDFDTNKQLFNIHADLLISYISQKNEIKISDDKNNALKNLILEYKDKYGLSEQLINRLNERIDLKYPNDFA